MRPQKKQISPKELRELYETKTNKEVCKILGVSQPTLLSYLNAAGIQLKGKGNPKLELTK